MVVSLHGSNSSECVNSSGKTAVFGTVLGYLEEPLGIRRARRCAAKLRCLPAGSFGCVVLGAASPQPSRRGLRLGLRPRAPRKGEIVGVDKPIVEHPPFGRFEVASRDCDATPDLVGICARDSRWNTTQQPQGRSRIPGQKDKREIAGRVAPTRETSDRTFGALGSLAPGARDNGEYPSAGSGNFATHGSKGWTNLRRGPGAQAVVSERLAESRLDVSFCNTHEARCKNSRVEQQRGRSQTRRRRGLLEAGNPAVNVSVRSGDSRPPPARGTAWRNG